MVGHDWGAALAWHMAMTAPARVSKLVTLSVGCLGESLAVLVYVSPAACFHSLLLAACCYAFTYVLPERKAVWVELW